MRLKRKIHKISKKNEKKFYSVKLVHPADYNNNFFLKKFFIPSISQCWQGFPAVSLFSC